MIGIRWIFLCRMLLAAEMEYESTEATLESVLGLNKSNHDDNLMFLDKVERVIGNLKTALESKSSMRRSANYVELEKFTDFLLNLLKKLNEYDNTELERFFRIFNEEVRKYHYKGCKFHELLENYSFRRFLSNTLKALGNQSGATIKHNLEAMANKIEYGKFNTNEKKLVEIINSLYRQDFVENFQYFLVKIDNYRLNTRKMDSDLVTIIKEGLRLIVFDYYSQLNNNARSALKHQVNELWDSLSRKSYEAQSFETRRKIKNNSRTRKTYDAKQGLGFDERADNTTEVQKQSLYLQNSIKNSKSDKIKYRRFGNEKDLNIDQTIQTDVRYIDVVNKNHDVTHQPTSQLLYTTRHFEARRKMLTFRTLYPDLVPEWLSSLPVPSRRYMPCKSPGQHNVAKGKMNHKTVRMKGRRLVKKSSSFDSSSPMLRIKSKSLRGRHKVPIKKSGLHLRKQIRRSTIYKTKQKKRIRGLRSKDEQNTSKRFGIKQKKIFFTHRANNYRRSYERNSMISAEGLSIETHDNFRRSDTNVTDPNGSNQFQITQSTLKIANTQIHENTTIIKDLNDEPLHNKDNFIRSQEKYNYFNVDSMKKGVLRYQLKNRVENTKGSKEINEGLEVNKQPKYKLDDDKIFNEEKNVVTTYNQKPSISVQTKQDYSNETEIKSKNDDINRLTITKNTFAVVLKNDSHTIEFQKKIDNKPEVEEKFADEIQPNEDDDKNNIKTDNDFKTFIDDYGDELDKFQHNKDKIEHDKITGRTERDTPTTETALTSTTATSVTRKPIITVPTIATTNSQTAVPFTTPSVIRKENFNQHDAAIMKSYFDADSIKRLMKKTTQRTTTRDTRVLGRYFNNEGVFVDSMEEVKEEVAEATNLYGGIAYDDKEES